MRLLSSSATQDTSCSQGASPKMNTSIIAEEKTYIRGRASAHLPLLPEANVGVGEEKVAIGGSMAARFVEHEEEANSAGAKADVGLLRGRMGWSSRQSSGPERGAGVVGERGRAWRVIAKTHVKGRERDDSMCSSESASSKRCSPARARVYARREEGSTSATHSV